jgi:DNA-binding response OmpR family regulator
MNRILVVDFDPITHQSFCNMLRDNGYEVICVSNAAEAIALFKTFLPRIVILERELPDGSGLALGKHFYETSAVGVIVFTHNDGDDARLSGLRYGVDLYLSKNISGAEMICYINNLLRRVSLLITYQTPWFYSSDTATLMTPTGQAIALTPTESTIMCLFAKRSGSPLTRDDFATALQKTTAQGFEKNLKVIMNRLRQKTLEIAAIELPLTSVRNVGYRFNAILSSFN